MKMKAATMDETKEKPYKFSILKSYLFCGAAYYSSEGSQYSGDAFIYLWQSSSATQLCLDHDDYYLVIHWRPLHCTTVGILHVFVKSRVDWVNLNREPS